MKAAYVYSDAFATYDLGPQHPLKPRRYARAYDLLRAYEAFGPDTPVVAPRPATEAELLTSHEPALIEAVQRVSREPDWPGAARYGFSQGDNPPVPGLYEASLIYTGASVTAAEVLLEGRSDRALNISGGLHHAMPDRVSGFCTFNDPAVAIHRLLERYERIVYLDTDAHHGDGVEAIFWRDPRVMTISLHESGRFLFPGTGFPQDLGEGAARGTAVNLPLEPDTGDDVFGWAFEQIVPPLLDAFRPQVIVTQFGADAHVLDPLAHLSVTTTGFEAVLRYYDSLGIPWLATGGGGYNLSVVPRVWGLVWAHMAGLELPDPLPDAYTSVYGGEVLRDPRGLAPEPSARARAAARDVVRKVKELVFPLHGLPAS